MSKIKTQSAQAGATIKSELKSTGVKARVKSSNFSMGDSVTVTVTDQPPAKLKEIEQLCVQYQYGHFNGMEDIYEYSNRRDDIPQSKYVSVDHEMTPAYRAELLAKVNAYYGTAYTYEQYDSYCGPSDFRSHFGANDLSNEVYRLSTGAIDYDAYEYHQSREDEVFAELERLGVEKYDQDAPIYLRDDSSGWQIGRGYGQVDCIEIVNIPDLPAAVMALQIFGHYQSIKDRVLVERAKYQAITGRNNREIIPVSVIESDRLDVAYFPSLNKNDDTDENDTAIRERSNRNNILVKHSITLTNEDYLIFSESLLTNRPYLLAGVGEHFIDDKHLEGLTEQTPEYYAAWREHGITTVVEVINANTNDVLIINTEGYNYARYVGRNAEWYADQTTRNILSGFTTAIR